MRVKNLYRLSQYNRRRHFTLVEIMVVIVIIAVILGITVPVFNSIATRKSVDAAASMIASAFRLARAEAAQRRVEVGIYFYVEDTLISGTTNHEYVALAWHPKYKSGTSFLLLPDSKKEYLPLGAVISFDSHDPGDFIVYYTPSGRVKIEGSPAASSEITLIEAIKNSDGKLIHLNDNNMSTVIINKYTGDVTVKGQ